MYTRRNEEMGKNRTSMQQHTSSAPKSKLAERFSPLRHGNYRDKDVLPQSEELATESGQGAPGRVERR